MRRINIGRAAGQKDSLHALDVFANDRAITRGRDQQRETAGP